MPALLRAGSGLRPREPVAPGPRGTATCSSSTDRRSGRHWRRSRSSASSSPAPTPTPASTPVSRTSSCRWTCPASRSDRCATWSAPSVTPASARSSSRTCRCPPRTSSVRSTAAGRWPRRRWPTSACRCRRRRTPVGPRTDRPGPARPRAQAGRRERPRPPSAAGGRLHRGRDHALPPAAADLGEGQQEAWS